MPITWTEPSKPNKEIPYTHVIAETPMGRIIIDWKGWKEFPSFDIAMPWGECLSECSLELAKELAQESWDKMMLNCMTHTDTTEDHCDPVASRSGAPTQTKLAAEVTCAACGHMGSHYKNGPTPCCDCRCPSFVTPVEALREALRKYGYHKSRCAVMREMRGTSPITSKCDCGWQDTYRVHCEGEEGAVDDSAEEIETWAHFANWGLYTVERNYKDDGLFRVRAESGEVVMPPHAYKNQEDMLLAINQFFGRKKGAVDE